MSDDNLISKIELIQEQIENLERSGWFTELEIDRLSSPLKTELATLKLCLTHSEMGQRFTALGLTVGEFIEATKRHNELFAKINEIDVIDAEILTQNQVAI